MYHGFEWRKKDGKQTYRFPEDVKAKSNSPRCNYCGFQLQFPQTKFRVKATTFENTKAKIQKAKIQKDKI